jgi:hypothetical protein
MARFNPDKKTNATQWNSERTRPGPKGRGVLPIRSLAIAAGLLPGDYSR